MERPPASGTFDPEKAGWTRATRPSFLSSIATVWHGTVDGEPSIGFFCEPRHDNGSGRMHGGILMTLADMGLGILVRHHRNAGAASGAPILNSPTIQLEVQFMGAVEMGAFVHTSAEIGRMTRSLVFTRGRILVGREAVASMQGIFKTLRAPTAKSQ